MLRKSTKSVQTLASIFYQTYQDYQNSLSIPDQDTETLNLKKQDWAQRVLRQLGLSVHTDSALPQRPRSESQIYVGNHVSYLDIAVLMSLIPEVTFVSKKEVASWPIIGKAAIRLGTQFIERHNKDHRQSVREQLIESLQKKPIHLAVFPSGTTQIEPKRPWRWGIFEVAHQTQIPVVGFKLNYSPLRSCAYIDKDILVPHLMRLTQMEKLSVTVTFAEPTLVTDPILQCQALSEWAEAPSPQ